MSDKGKFLARILIWVWWSMTSWIKIPYWRWRKKRDNELWAMKQLVQEELRRYGDDSFFTQMQYGKHRQKEDK